jgi:hypothetical protein
MGTRSKHLVFVFPELLLVRAGGTLLLGRYTGYRLLELIALPGAGRAPDSGPPSRSACDARADRPAAHRGVLGLNERNCEYIMRYNPRRLYPLVDDKLATKELAMAAGIACRNSTA